MAYYQILAVYARFSGVQNDFKKAKFVDIFTTYFHLVALALAC